MIGGVDPLPWGGDDSRLQYHVTEDSGFDSLPWGGGGSRLPYRVKDDRGIDLSSLGDAVAAGFDIM